METHKKETSYNHLYAGFVTALMLIIYFLIMRAGGLAMYPEFRLFNFLILFSGVYYAMKRESDLSDKGFLSRLGDGCLTVFVAVSAFSVFIFTWLSYDTVLLEALKQTSIMNSFVAPETAAIAVFAEGIASGVTIAYILISYTDSRSTAKQKQNESDFPK